MAGDYTDFLISLVIRKAGSEWAFEKFCCRQMRSIDGFDYLPTSRTYDWGADGRSRTRRGNGESYIVATKQDERLPAKAAADLKRLLQNDRRPAMVVFYFTELTTEVERKKIEKEILKLLKSPHLFRVFGRDQIIEQVQQRSSAFEDTYRNAIEEIRRMTAPSNRRSIADVRLGYQILLSAQMDKAGVDLRREIVKSFVLEALEERQGATESDIANRITESLQLLTPIDPFYVSPVVDELKRAGLISSENGHLSLRRIGEEFVRQRREQAASESIEGYGAIRTALADVLGQDIPEQDYAKVWITLKDGLVELFHENGIDVVKMVQKLSDKGGWGKAYVPDVVADGLSRVAYKISQLRLSHSDAEQIGMALPVALLDKPSGARQWLARLCLLYVGGCALGLHPEAIQRLEERIQRWKVIPDTHIILSLFAKGEPDHDETVRLLRTWTQAGGQIMAMSPIVAEVQRHADIGESIAKKWASFFRLRKNGNKPLCPDENTFLRSAIKLYGEKVAPSKVIPYIGRFTSNPLRNLQALVITLRDDFLFNVVSNPPTSDQSLEQELFDAVVKVRNPQDARSERRRENAFFRCQTDATCLAFLAEYRKLGDRFEDNTVILSRSTDLREVCERFQSRIGFSSPYINPDRLVFLLTLSPRNSFTLSTVERMLFGDTFERHAEAAGKLGKKVMKKLQQAGDEDWMSGQLSTDVDRHITG